MTAYRAPKKWAWFFWDPYKYRIIGTVCMTGMMDARPLLSHEFICFRAEHASE
jgi:hypothetical protein